MGSPSFLDDWRVKSTRAAATVPSISATGASRGIGCGPRLRLKARNVDLHHRYLDEPGDSVAGSRQADDRSLDPFAQGRGKDRTADRHAHRLHDADGAAA